MVDHDYLQLSPRTPSRWLSNESRTTKLACEPLVKLRSSYSFRMLADGSPNRALQMLSHGQQTSDSIVLPQHRTQSTARQAKPFQLLIVPACSASTILHALRFLAGSLSPSLVMSSASHWSALSLSLWETKRSSGCPFAAMPASWNRVGTFLWIGIDPSFTLSRKWCSWTHSCLVLGRILGTRAISMAAGDKFLLAVASPFLFGDCLVSFSSASVPTVGTSCLLQPCTLPLLPPSGASSVLNKWDFHGLSLHHEIPTLARLLLLPPPSYYLWVWLLS